jgi:hypothetical protein
VPKELELYRRAGTPSVRILRRKRGPELLRPGPEEVLAALDPTRTTTFATADSLNYLLAIVVQRAEEYPSLQTVEAVALLISLVLLVGGGWVCAVR